MTTLNEQNTIEYVRRLPELEAIVGAGELRSVALTEGNVNLLFRVSSVAEPQRSVLLKQALPHSWRYPDFIMPVERQRIELEVLQLEARYSPGFVPAIYSYDAEQHIIALEDLNQHIVLREGLIKQQRYPLLAEHIGRFMARSLFYTSDLYLESAEKKALVPRFINAVMCKVQEDLVFTQPYIEHPNNRWTSLLNAQVAAIRADDELRSEVFFLKERYLSHAQALLHNDLHTGSILLNERDTRVIDPEFAFFGPIGHDVGSYLANLIISYAAQEHHAPDAAARSSYRAWILESLRSTWEIFAAEWQELWESKGNAEWPSATFRRDYLRKLLQDSAGYAGTEIIRRIIGMAHVQDFWLIDDDQTRAAAEQIALEIAVRWIKERHSIASIDELLSF